MSKQQKRTRRKIERGRRNRANARAAGALAAGAVIAAGTQAYADPIRFDNPAEGQSGYFSWEAPNGDGLFLDVTLPSDNQPGTAGASGVYQTSSTHYLGRLSTWGDGSLGGTAFNNVGGFSVVAPYEAGDLISSVQSFGQTAYVGYGATIPGLFPDGEERYVGMRFRFGLSDPFHYGWIGVIRRPGTDHLDAFAWGYESDAGVPVPAGAPEPASLALLAIGATAVVRRRRRSG